MNPNLVVPQLAQRRFSFISRRKLIGAVAARFPLRLNPTQCQSSAIRIVFRRGCATAVPSITFNAELRDTMPNTLTKPQVKLQPKTQRSKLYKVILLNDDYTPREFVVAVLKGVFRRPNL
jgi:ATP-dependent Clp protease adaptor protein ClpS